MTPESRSLWNWTHIRKPRPRGNPYFSINDPGIFFEPGHVLGPRNLAPLPRLSQHRGWGGGHGPAAFREPGSLEAFEEAAGCSARLCPTGTSTAPRPARCSQQSRVATPPPSQTQGGSPAKRVRPPSGSGNKENCNKKLTDSRRPWRRALACAPLSIWAAEATLVVGAWRRLRPRGAQHSDSTPLRVPGYENDNKILATPIYSNGMSPPLEGSRFLWRFPSSCRVSLQRGRLNDSRAQRTTTESPAPRYKFL